MAFSTRIIISAKNYASKVFKKMQKDANGYRRSLYRVNSQTRFLSENSRRLTTTLASAAAAYGAFTGGSHIIKTAVEYDSLERSIFAATGSMEESAKYIKYIENESERLGLRVGVLMKGFKDLAGATRGTNLEGKETKKIFSAIATTSAAMALSTESTTLMIKAFRDMVSKGKISSEELTQQLGDHMPGALRIAAKAMDKTTSELLDMMRKGELMADDLLPRLSRAMYLTYKDSSSKSLDSARANLNRLQNSMDGIIRTLSKSEVMTVFIKMIKNINMNLGFWLYQNDAFIKQDLPNYFAKIYAGVASVSSFISNNKAIAEYGLIGFILKGRKGLIYGSILGSLLPNEIATAINEVIKNALGYVIPSFKGIVSKGFDLGIDQIIVTYNNNIRSYKQEMEQLSNNLKSPLNAIYKTTAKELEAYKASINNIISATQQKVNSLKASGVPTLQDIKLEPSLRGIYSEYHNAIQLINNMKSKLTNEQGLFQDLFLRTHQNQDLPQESVSQIIEQWKKKFSELLEKEKEARQRIAHWKKVKGGDVKEKKSKTKADYDSYLAEHKKRMKKIEAEIKALFADIPTYKPTEKVDYSSQFEDFKVHALNMKNLAGAAYDDMAQSFSTLFVDAVCGDLKRAEDYFKAFFRSIATDFGNYIGKELRNGIYNMIGNFLTPASALPLADVPGIGAKPTIPPDHIGISPSKRINRTSTSSISPRIIINNNAPVNVSTRTRKGTQSSYEIDIDIENAIVARAMRGNSPINELLENKYGLSR